MMEFGQENGWLDFHGPVLVDPENRVAVIYATEQDNGDTYGHVCLIQGDDEPAPLTSGKFEVTRLVKWDFGTDEM